ncbi:MAG: aspartate carbamoyltransferase regulatory subunit [Duncaniella sp.]|nr:aspartate carbamoyltransferase regulatory subunit [Duncaniella sp.]MDE6582892.1 aspartate carbamoyltransferase regulatory subunit [Duncaniella sp.]
MKNHPSKELAVAALRNGTVIDHIASESLFKAVKILGLDKLTSAVTIGFNLDSAKLGKKGIIKVADVEFPEELLNRIAIIAPNAVVNIIRDYEVVEKRNVVLPETIKGLVKCSNPKCITNNEPMSTIFTVDSNGDELTCHYCGRSIHREDATIL